MTTRDLAERDLVAAARDCARTLYEGEITPHRSCGIALAETFGLETRPYQALRKGGITGCGECGAVVAGRLVLGELLGDPDPTGGVTPALRAAATAYEHSVRAQLERGAAGGDSLGCNHLTAQFADFAGRERASFCAAIAATAAACAAAAAISQGVELQITDPRHKSSD